MAYSIVDSIIKGIDNSLTAADVHGIATGMLCVNIKTPPSRWLADFMLPDIELSAQHQQILEHLFLGTQRLLISSDGDFNLFLPNDEAFLSDQVDALKSWCQGFLYGVGATTTSATTLSKEATEIFKDMTEITRLDSDVEGNEDEAAFTEIYEYVRSVVILLCLEFNQPKVTATHSQYLH
ncbi:MAG: YecA family protein [Methylococcaceae bacterium]|jgi:uncharacterized protein YgfB (UPF0149 family)|nr:MAG: YecA family protein [Methylococcaceae bacterium]